MMALEKRRGRVLEDVDFQTGKSLTVCSSVDITEQCPLRRITPKRAILDYGRAFEGIFVRVVDWEEELKDVDGKEVEVKTEASVVVFLHRFNDMDHPGLASFKAFAQEFGLTPAQLVCIVRELVPMPADLLAA